jgi:hypothetical protein
VGRRAGGAHTSMTLPTARDETVFLNRRLWRRSPCTDSRTWSAWRCIDPTVIGWAQTIQLVLDLDPYPGRYCSWLFVKEELDGRPFP